MELSFGVDKEIVVSKLEEYFDHTSQEVMVFEEENELALDSRAKANAVLRALNKSNWIEFEMGSHYSIKVILYDYAATMIESFQKIVKSEDMEYPGAISQIYSTLKNEESYEKPYEYIIKQVEKSTKELIGDLKKTNTAIKKRIDAITREKTAAEIVKDFFFYHKEIGSKAYHRLKTSDNISRFRIGILEKLNYILEEPRVFDKAVIGFMEIEQVEDRTEAEQVLKETVYSIISSFRLYDDIIEEIDAKHSKYMNSAVARAEFLLSHANNTEGKLSQILSHLAEEFNEDESLVLNEEADEGLLNIFNIFPQNFLDGSSLYSMPISRKMEVPVVIDDSFGLSEEERQRLKREMWERNQKRFSRKNINTYVMATLGENKRVLASTLPLANKRDLIRMIFISLYGRVERSDYTVEPVEKIIQTNGFRFTDFLIVRRDENGNI
jgi:hypothetical protein